MKNKKLSLVVLCCLLLAGLMLLGFNRHAVADALQDLHGDRVFANYLFTENVISSSLRVQGDKLRINMAGGDGGFGMTSGVGIAAGKSVLQGVDWSPAIQIVGSPGTHIYGPLAFANNSGRGPGVAAENCIGLGTGKFNNGCSIEANSSDADGQLWLTAGLGAGSEGRVTMDFSQTWPSEAVCTLTLVDLQASWDTKATVKIIGTNLGNSRSSLTVAWNNGGVPLPDIGQGPGNGINYHCLALP